MESLKQAIYEAQITAKAAEAALRSAQDEYAKAVAHSLGVSVGSDIITTSTRGYGAKTKTVVSRYRVTAIRYRSYGNVPFTLIGNTVRKDGSIGSRHEIYQDWKPADTVSA